MVLRIFQVDQSLVDVINCSSECDLPGRQSGRVANTIYCSTKLIKCVSNLRSKQIKVVKADIARFITVTLCSVYIVLGSIFLTVLITSFTHCQATQWWFIAFNQRGTMTFPSFAVGQKSSWSRVTASAQGVQTLTPWQQQQQQQREAALT